MKNSPVSHNIKVNLPGGIVSPGDLTVILQLAQKCGVNEVRFGNRQQLLFKLLPEALDDFTDGLQVHEIDFEVDADVFPNIVSSYVTEEVLYTPNWLREGVYKDILDSFSFRPRLKVNVVDHSQNLIPFFTGNLNFISSATSNFWYLYVRFPKTTTMYCWPSLIYTEDIAGITRAIETVLIGAPETLNPEGEYHGQLLVDAVNRIGNFLVQEFERPLVHTDFQLPYYEGFNRYRDQKLWLGIYRRGEDFAVDFLIELCQLCLTTRIGQLYTTAWKSIIVKNIDLADRIYWSNLLNRYRLNVRHSANELNWQLEDLCDEALALKIQLVRQFEEADLRTYRLCFAIKTVPRTGLFGSVVIRKRRTRDAGGRPLYEVMHTRDFNPNSKDYVSVDRELSESQLGPRLIDVCASYYAFREQQAADRARPPKPDEPLPPEPASVWQCRFCLSRYDGKYGDSSQHLSPGTAFETISEYTCPTCDAPKSAFEPLPDKTPADRWKE